VNPKHPVLAACALALSQLISVAANAQAATNVICDRCVNNSDLANSSVTSEKILDGTVKSNDIATSAIKTANMNNGSVTFGKLATGVRDALDGALAHLTKTTVADSAEGDVAEAICPSSRIAISANCLCDNNNGINNYGVLFACFVDGNGALAACFDEAGTFNPTKDPPIARVEAVCLGAESTDGTPWDPTPAGAVEAQAAWHKAQYEAFKERAAELRAQREAHRAALLKQ
jgi:hypothetical protein